ncbi:MULTISPECIES: NepR family anti-sigma factor [Methylobacterium]|jgi:hypothetical protein|uniref:Anti-sigma factor NepR domain-containing protein n=1 Tax=Methylobacterium hispanicum TaxID=270350 RepID=A0AAV4ZS01_9HYPH|nr:MULTISPECIES: NepR family anti-sigma factor [Methylobacterium]GJD91267.1 hypothetical protein BHAOGJBA_4815 [Methylobacterium hispanicum]
MNDDGKAGAVHAEGMPAVEEAAPATEQAAVPMSPERVRPSDSSLNEFARTRLGTHLRAMYDAVVQQPVPDQFRDLIARLEAGEARAAEDPER